MGYINKAKGSADTGASDHIKRKTIPKNADPTRIHLNRELVEFPDGVSDRTSDLTTRRAFSQIYFIVPKYIFFRT